jgi:hypothetical protein
VDTVICDQYRDDRGRCADRHSGRKATVLAEAKSDGAPLWDGKAELRARIALPDEQPSDGLMLVYLVELDASWLGFLGRLEGHFFFRDVLIANWRSASFAYFLA